RGRLWVRLRHVSGSHRERGRRRDRLGFDLGRHRDAGDVADRMRRRSARGRRAAAAVALGAARAPVGGLTVTRAAANAAGLRRNPYPRPTTAQAGSSYERLATSFIHAFALKLY